MIDYLSNRKGYGGWNHPTRRWSPLAWCVKIYNVDETGGWKLKVHEPIDPFLNDDWNEYFKENYNDLWETCLEATRYQLDNYTTYPGDDGGDWKFCFGGRSGGWLILSSWKNYDFLSTYGSHSFTDMAGWLSFLEDLSFSELKTLYRGVVCMDHDFSRENVENEVSYQLNFQRVLWEDGIRETAREEIEEEKSKERETV